MTHREMTAIAFAINALAGKNRMKCLRNKELCEETAEVFREMLKKEIG